MATTTDVTTQPASGLTHIDALLNSNVPGWNFLAPSRTTLYYTFSLASGNGNDIGNIITAAPSAFNATQEAAAVAALARVAAITGITFVATSDGALADLHFAVANIIGASTAGICSSTRGYSSTNGVITNYTAESYIYLDNVEHAGSNNAPSVGTNGFQVILHELGHAMGLKHPFEGGVQLPPGQDNTANTLMSYTNTGGPYSDFRPYDIAALKFLYGGDGLAGVIGQNTGAVYLTGTTSSETLTGGTGDDSLDGGAGNDTLNGGNGNDTAVFHGLRSAYTINANGGNGTVSGPDGTDTLASIENAKFDDQTVVLAAGGGNSPPTGSVVVNGTAAQGALLSAASTLADPDGIGPLSYAWQSSPDGNTWTAIGGATSSTLLLAEAQVGKRVRVVASYTDGAGKAESSTSAATTVVTNVNDAPTGSVLISGTVQPNSLLSASDSLADADGLGAFGYQWQSSTNGQTWNDIAGATGSSFAPGTAQVGLRLRVVVSYVDGHGTSESVPSAATIPVPVLNAPPTGAVGVSGTAQQGQTLTAQNTLADPDGLGTISYRWQSSADGVTWLDIGGGNGPTLALQQAQVGRQVRAVASYVDGKGTTEAVSSQATTAVLNVNDPPVGTLAIAGTAQQGQSLNAQPAFTDADGIGILNYRWQSSADGSTNWTDIAGATSANFFPAQQQVGRFLRVAVNYVDQQGSSETLISAATAAILNANDPPTGGVNVAGTPRQGTTLIASNTLADVDGLGTIAYQWQVASGIGSWDNIAGATGTSFVPGQAQVGKLVRVLATYTDGQGTVESVPGTTGTAVLNVNDAPTGALTITGAPRPGQALTVTSTLADADGLGTLGYEWQSSTNGSTWLAISGATGSSYTPGNGQIGLQLRVLGRYTDGQGTVEVVFSAATTAVSNAINGTAGNDTLAGTAFADELNGLQGNDRIDGGAGNDLINGGAGIDTAVYAGARSAYTVGTKGATVQARSGNEGNDTLQQVERVAFSDVSLAFDLDGQAGVTAKLIGAVFGAAAVSNTRFTGIGLQLLGAGTSSNDLAQLALEARLGAAFTPAAEITLLYQNLLGIAPSAGDLAFWQGALSAGQFTPASLALLAADTAFNTQNIGLVGLVDNGLAFLPNP